MVSYYVNMRLSGRLTQLPDSQKLFGALIYLYAEHLSAEKASEFVAKIKDGGIYFSLSNMLPFNYLPTPQTYLFNKMSFKNTKQTYKSIKKRQYLKKDQITKLLADQAKADTMYPYVCEKPSQQIHAAIDSLFYKLPGLDPNLYSVPEITIVTVENADQEAYNTGIPMTQFGFYLSFNECEETADLMNALDIAKQNEKVFILGPRTSQGLNLFTIINITPSADLVQEKAMRYLNTGMLLPKEISFTESTLKLFTSERRPYNRPGGWEKDYTKQFISFVQAGSVICPTNSLKEVGMSIPSPFDKDRAIFFGNAFQYPLATIGGEPHDKI